MKNKGISLIVLVVTIIIIIILAGAVILSLTQNSPINEANEAMFKSNIDTYTSEITLYVSKQFGQTGGIYNLNDLNKDSSTIKEVINSIKNEDISKFEIENGKLVYIKAECSENEIKWLTEMGIKEKGNVPPVTTIPIPPNGNIFIDKDGKEVPIPEGFIIDTSNNIVNDGLVIKDTIGNEFVWIPALEVTGGFTRRALRGEIFSSSEYHEDYPLDSGEYKEITDSVNKYKGFYVARYEAGLPTGGTTSITNGTQKPVSKKGATVWNSIRFTADINDKTGTTDGALKVAKSMYNTANVKSTLLYPAHWDTIMQWLLDAPAGTLKNGTNIVLDNKTEYKSGLVDAVGTPSNEILQNSSRWGNYNSKSTYQGLPVSTANGGLKTAGSNEAYRVKNIYDLAGNVDEWNFEAYSSGRILRVVRSGLNFSSGASVPAAYRSQYSPDVGTIYYGFRTTLYIK